MDNSFLARATSSPKDSNTYHIPILGTVGKGHFGSLFIDFSVDRNLVSGSLEQPASGHSYLATVASSFEAELKVED